MGVKYLYGIDVTGQSTFSTNVGIGTLSPGYRLSVIGASSTDAFGLFSGGSGGTKGGIYLGNDGFQYGSLWFDNATNDVVLRQNYSNGNLIFGTNSTEKVRITSAGNLLIGTTADSGYKLDVSGSTRSNEFIFPQTIFNPSAAARSTTSPMSIKMWNNYFNGIGLGADYGTVLEYYSLNGHVDSQVYFDASGGSWYRTASYASNFGSWQKYITSLDISGSTNYISKFTSANSLGNSIVYDNGTNVGIGTTSPAAKLTVVGATTVIGQTNVVARFSDDLNSTLLISHPASTSAAATITGNEQLGFATGAVGSIAERMRITSAGNVGIGTTAPAYKLDVVGTGGFTNSGSSNTLTLSHSSGSGIALNISKGGNGEGLYVNKTSGTGNAVTVIGTLNATTLVKNGGTSTQYLMADGSVSTLTNPVTGTGTTNYLPKWTSGSAIGNSIVTEDGGNTLRIIAASAAVRLDGSRDYLLQTVDTDGRFRIYDQTAALERITLTSGGNVGIGTTSPGGKLDVYTAGSSGWDKFVVTNTALWGDGSIQYVTIGAGGASGIMMFNPHVVWNSGKSTAAIRLGRSGGISSGAYYEIGTGASDSFFIAKNGFGLEPRFYINSAGNVGIGTTAPAATLHVVSGGVAAQGGNGASGLTSPGIFIGGDGTNGLIYSRQSSTWKNAYLDSANLFINAQSGGNVGIGTTSPTGKLEIASAANTYATAPAMTFTDTSGDGSSNRWIVGNIATTYGTFNIASAPNASSTTYTPRLSILSSGNVGIGTTAPGTKLQVEGTIRATGTTGIVDVDPLYGAFRFYNGSTFYGGFYNDAVLSAGNAVDLVSYVATGDYYIGSATTAKAVKVEQGGNVGIGTTSPTTKLDVNGVVNATSFSAGGTAGFTGMVVIATNPPGSQMLNFQGGLLVSVS